jgi:hypothetical protein
LATQHLAADETKKETAPGKPGVYESGGKQPQLQILQILSLRGLAFFRFFHRGFGADETDLGMLAVAERLVQAAAATTERESRLTGEIEFITRGVNQLNRSFGSFHSIWAV